MQSALAHSLDNYKAELICSVDSYEQLVKYKEGTDYCKNTTQFRGNYDLNQGETSLISLTTTISNQPVSLGVLKGAGSSAGFESDDKQKFWQFADDRRYLDGGKTEAVFLWRYTNYGAGFCKFNLSCTVRYK